ncbi:PREDICTED: THAP domain-containing protein 4-like [Eufriesea mexicana]|uniref:THAP domain-containing protein 4-like n=1 Tax=Eufriesea mexicana TaxID=516756 RepID=UPI00083BBE68|nr:PREDICTED: THAP domain-containing protein 4-like [Eufriesea mexicana]
MKELPMHEVIKPLAWLKGIWKTKDPGVGKFPTIKSFTYCEEMTFTSIGQPMLNYVAKSWNIDTGNPMHYEVGFLKIIPNTNIIQLLLSHNFGVTTVEEGVIKDKIIELKATNIGRPTDGIKSPAVIELRRQFELIGDYLHHTLYMATENTPKLQEHLHAVYVKKNEDTS